MRRLRISSGALAVFFMGLAVLAVYFPVDVIREGHSLFGMDFRQLHQFRLEFARAAIAAGDFPAWYPRELLGTPFWSNLQNFPWIPTRLVMLLLEPRAVYAYAVGLSAFLSALFTYLYLRGQGLSPVASAAGGWTFACAGFFAARVMAGHLPLLEAYPALPLLLWLCERAAQPGAEGAIGRGAWLAFAAACTVVAGHPQVPLYACVAACAYAVWRWPNRAGLRNVALIALGAASTLAVWWPMTRLLGRSTRVLALNEPTQDIPLPYERLKALFAPWIHGWPSDVVRAPAQPFQGFPNVAYFWDTVAYVGLLPWVAVAALLVHALLTRRRPRSSFLALAVFGAFALVTALPLIQELRSLIGGTYVRSPARQLYVTGFALSVGFAVGVDWLARTERLKAFALRAALVSAVLAVHGLDLGAHDKAFIRTRPGQPNPLPALDGVLATELGSFRVGIDKNLPIALNRRYDDVGFFDSVILARPYSGLLALAGAPAGVNVQALNGSDLPKRALAALGVRFVLTTRPRPDLQFRLTEGGLRLFEVADPTPRAQVFFAGNVQSVPPAEVLSTLRNPGFSFAQQLLLPSGVDLTGGTEGTGEVSYKRLTSDRFVLKTSAPQSGWVRVMESFDPGWTATVNGEQAEVFPANNFAMAVRIPAGTAELNFEFHTPGAATGLVLSLLALLALGGLLLRTARRTSSG